MPAPVLALQLSRESNSDQKSEGREFLSHPGQSFLCPCVSPIPAQGLIPDGIFGNITLGLTRTLRHCYLYATEGQ